MDTTKDGDASASSDTHRQSRDAEGAWAQEVPDSMTSSSAGAMTLTSTMRGTSRRRTSRRPSFSLIDVNDDEKDLYSDGVAADEEAPYPAKLVETARSSARNGQPYKNT